MKKVLFFFLIFSGILHSQNSKFNLDFEIVSNQDELPDGWSQQGNFNTEIDTENKISGDYAIKISSLKDRGAFSSIIYKIPANYNGRLLSFRVI